jgi:uncharacterized membrane protein YqaE (UPF0057 family)
MDRYYILYQSIRILLVVLLFVVPFGYCLLIGNLKKGFWFTWIVWSVVIFVFGMLLPTLAVLRERATGTQSDIMCGGFVLGILTGWLPGLIFASIGEIFHNVFVKILSKNKHYL